jgi:hypothetical protein
MTGDQHRAKDLLSRQCSTDPLWRASGNRDRVAS